jgi:L-aminopeptidase/D-esterase-like protein
VKVGRGRGPDQAEASGQGGAFRQVGPTKLAVFSVVNAVGAIVDRHGQVVRGNLNAATGVRQHLADSLNGDLGRAEPNANEQTTLTVLITNQKLDPHFLRQLGRQVHSAMARAIQPFHTPYDGDILYAVTTGSVDNPALDGVALGTLASEVAWDAVLSII